MYELQVKAEFSAAHHIEGYPGDCARKHGHNFGVDVIARSQGLDSIGIAVDFKKLKGALREVIEAWDHQDLNSLPDFERDPPTAEVIARKIYDRLQAQFTGQVFWLHQVTVWENPRSAASYLGPAVSGAKL